MFGLIITKNDSFQKDNNISYCGTVAAFQYSYVQVVSPAILPPNKGHFAWVQLEFPSRKREVMKKWANYFFPSYHHRFTFYP